MTQPYDNALGRERKANLSTAAEWDRFTSHRANLMAQLLDVRTFGRAGVAGPPGSAPRALSLCVLGAGNCNDLDLAELAKHYTEIDLVDLDADALTAAVRRYPEAVRAKLRCHAPVELSGLLLDLGRWQRFELSEKDALRQPAVAATRIRQQLGRVYDCVLSACILTQLQLAVLRELGADHPWFLLATRTVSLTHLRTLRELTGPGGRGLLATEITSNATAPLAELAGVTELLPALDSFIAARNVIGVAHPGDLRAIALDDPWLAARVSAQPPHRAWLWQQGPSRTFLTYGMWLDPLPDTAE